MPAKITKYDDAVSELNIHRNLDEFPRGWLSTALTVTQLKKLKVPSLKVFLGWKDSGKGYVKPILVNAYPGNKKYVRAVESYQPNPRRASKPAKRAAEEYAEQFDPDEEYQQYVERVYPVEEYQQYIERVYPNDEDQQ